MHNREYGPRHGTAVALLRNLGVAHAELGDTEKARSLRKRAAAITEHK